MSNIVEMSKNVVENVENCRKMSKNCVEMKNLSKFVENVFSDFSPYIEKEKPFMWQAGTRVRRRTRSKKKFQKNSKKIQKNFKKKISKKN